MTTSSDISLPRFFSALIISVGFAAMLIVNLPGHLEFDSIRQLLEGQRGIYSNWHPPIMSWLLGVADQIKHGAAPFVVFEATMAYGVILSLLFLARKPSWLAVPGAVASVMLPQLFLFQAIVWKDILFADSCLVSFVLLAHATVHWNRAGVRIGLIAGSSAFTMLAILTRQNGVVILPCAAIALGMTSAVKMTRRHGLIYGVGFFCLTATLAIAANAALQLRATKALGAVEQMEDLQLYDIGGMLKRQPDLELTVLQRESPKLAIALKTKGPHLYTPIGHDRLTDDTEIRSFIISSVSVVGRQWRALVVANFSTYLAVRAEDFGWLFLSRHPSQCLTYAVGVIGPAADMAAAGLKWRYDGRDQWLDEDYASPLIGTPIFSHPVFAVIGLLSLVLLLRRRGPADIAIAGLLIATAIYTFSYFVISISCQYRYLYAIDLSSIAAGFYLLATTPATVRLSKSRDLHHDGEPIADLAKNDG